MKEDEMFKICSMHEQIRIDANFGLGNLKRWEYLGDLGVTRG
jgi:hypothetical protein